VRIIDVQQNSPEWLAARLGIPTASEFARIITAVKGDLSKSARKYAHDLVAETLLGRPLDTGANTFAMQRGHDLEPAAAAQYELTHGVETKRVGFITTNDGRVGCSPDRLIVGTRRGIEIKCRLDSGHMAMLLDGPDDDHKQQCQGILAVAELESLDLYGWHPELPEACIRIERDEPYIAKMGAALVEFLAMRDEMLAKAKASGWQAREAAPRPATFGAIKFAA
jgi:YqaJ-like viral recombinase domain